MATGFRGVNHRNLCDISQHSHETLQQLFLNQNISAILNASSSVYNQTQRSQICLCYLLVNINLADILKSIFSFAVNFETFSGAMLWHFCVSFLDAFLNQEKTHVFYLKFHIWTFLFVLLLFHPLQNLICDQNLCHLLKSSLPHIRLLNCFQPSNHVPVVASFWKCLCRFSGPVFKFQVYGSEQ